MQRIFAVINKSDVSILRLVIHYFLHFGFPGLIAWFFFRQHWKQAWLILVATMLVDLDHLLSSPVFDADRCSIGFHPLHSYYAIAVYGLLLLFPKVRLIALGLLLHMASDYLDCLWL